MYTNSNTIQHLSIQTAIGERDARLEQQVNINQQLATQLRQGEERLLHKDEELRQKNADISRLQGAV